jgi:hypothetical protein
MTQLQVQQTVQLPFKPLSVNVCLIYDRYDGDKRMNEVQRREDKELKKQECADTIAHRACIQVTCQGLSGATYVISAAIFLKLLLALAGHGVVGQ